MEAHQGGDQGELVASVQGRRCGHELEVWGVVCEEGEALC